MPPIVRRRIAYVLDSPSQTKPRIQNQTVVSIQKKMTDKNTSTVKSYADSAVAAGQSLFGSITGNPVDEVS